MKICFVVDSWTRIKGGVELQSYLVAKGLKGRGWRVVYVTLNPVKSNVFQTFCAPKLFGSNGWLPRYSRAVSLFRVLRKINPDVVFVSYAGALSGFVAFYAVLYKKVFVFRAASMLDSKLGRGLHERGFMARLLYRLALRKCEALVVNAGYIEREFRRQLPNKKIFTVSNGVRIDPLHRRTPSHVLWIGRYQSLKRPDLYLDLAKALPNVRFIICGWGPLRNRVVREAKEIPNLTLAGEVTGRAKQSAIEKAFVLVNTSIAEGFPNTLIEAGLYGIPYVSFVDPDEVICKYGLGYHVRSFNELVEKTEAIVLNAKLRKEIGNRIRSYVERNHDLENTISSYDKIIKSLSRSGSSS